MAFKESQVLKTHQSQSETIIKRITNTVPAGASENIIVDLPPGLYHISAVAQHTGSGADGSVQCQVLGDAGQTVAIQSLKGIIQDGSVPTGSPLVEVAQPGTVFTWFPHNATSFGEMPIPVPFGLQFVFTKGGVTSIDLILVAQRMA